MSGAARLCLPALFDEFPRDIAVWPVERSVDGRRHGCLQAATEIWDQGKGITLSEPCHDGMDVVWQEWDGGLGNKRNDSAQPWERVQNARNSTEGCELMYERKHETPERR